MLLMWRLSKKMLLLLILIVGTSSLFATSAIDEKVLKYEEKRIAQDKRIELKSVKIHHKTKIDVSGWYGYVFQIEAHFQDKDIQVKDILFSNGTIIAPELLDMRTGASLKQSLNPKLGKKYYDSKYRIAGNENAKHKLVIFSDPLCPFCIDYVPEVIKTVKNNPQTFALYYYHFPLLSIHPAADTMIKAMHIAKEKGVKDVELKVYTTDFEKDFTAKETNSKKILAALNKVLGTSISLKEIQNPAIQEAIEYEVGLGEDALVRGTPTIFFDGVVDKTRLKYDKVINK